MRVGEPPPARREGEGVTTGGMTAGQAIELVQGPRRAELQGILDGFFAAWGYDLAHFPRMVHFAALLLWIEERGAVLPGGPGAGVAGEDEKQ